MLMFVQLGSGVGGIVHFFHPNAPSYLRTHSASFFRRREMEKKRDYGDRRLSFLAIFLA